jgi:WD40 repeat protein
MTTNKPAAVDEAGFGAALSWSPDSRELFGCRRVAETVRWQVEPATNGSSPILRQLELQKPAGFVYLTVSSNIAVWTSATGSRATLIEDIDTHENFWAPTIPGVGGISPDNRWFAVYRPYTPVLFVYRLPSLELAATITNKANIGGFSFTPAGDEVAISSSGQIEFWNTATWERSRELTEVNLPTPALFEPSGKTFWLGRDSRIGGLYHSATLEPILTLPTGMIPLGLSADGRKLAVSLHGQRIQVWDLGEVRKRLRELNLDWPDE